VGADGLPHYLQNGVEIVVKQFAIQRNFIELPFRP
jgi:hypothetical protein